ncbi:MAG: carbohydrate kinase, partial [Chloroflexi bacterium]|nr:carbohydrate kinase [Chloroflexota bacterium]
GLTPAHGPGHLLRAVYEGTAYGNRRILDKLGELGVPTSSIVACGGGTRSALWLQILADVAGVPISLTTVSDAVSLGSAICAAVGAGAFADLRTAGQAMVRLSTTVEPDTAKRAIYDEGYSRYKDTYSALAPLFQRPFSG